MTFPMILAVPIDGGHKHHMPYSLDDISDPYARCPEDLDDEGNPIPGTSRCQHDLARSISTEEIFGEHDGPKGVWHPLLLNTIDPDFDPETGEDL